MNSLIKRNQSGELERDIDIFDLPRSFFPEMKVEEKYNSILVKANIPGMKKENIHVKLQNNILTVSGEERNQKEKKLEDGYYCNSSCTSFSQSIPLPTNINGKNIKTKYINGVLEINITKKQKLISSKK